MCVWWPVVRSLAQHHHPVSHIATHMVLPLCQLCSMGFLIINKMTDKWNDKHKVDSTFYYLVFRCIQLSAFWNVSEKFHLFQNIQSTPNGITKASTLEMPNPMNDLSSVCMRVFIQLHWRRKRYYDIRYDTILEMAWNTFTNEDTFPSFLYYTKADSTWM